jgi:hypothetical protein
MLWMSSGRSVPFQPGRVEVIVCIVLAKCPTIAAIVIGPPPPWMMSAGRPSPASSTVSA